MKPKSICFNLSPSPFCKHDEPECHSKSLDIDDLYSAAQSLNPIVTLAMVELHPLSLQFAPHAKSLKNTVGSWIFCLSMMFNYFFTNCNWIFENLFWRPFCSFEVLEFFFPKWSSNFFSWWAIDFFLIKCCWNFCWQNALDFFFSWHAFQIFLLSTWGIWFLKFLSSKFGLCLL